MRPERPTTPILLRQSHVTLRGEALRGEPGFGPSSLDQTVQPESVPMMSLLGGALTFPVFSPPPLSGGQPTGTGTSVGSKGPPTSAMSDQTQPYYIPNPTDPNGPPIYTRPVIPEPGANSSAGFSIQANTTYFTTGGGTQAPGSGNPVVNMNTGLCFSDAPVQIGD